MVARYFGCPNHYRYCRISLRGGAICRLIRVIRWFGDETLMWKADPQTQGRFSLPILDQANIYSIVFDFSSAD
jgi:hypothetical protein